MEVTKDDAEALQEKLNQMSPEEMKEFAKSNCIFCQIVEGKVQSKKIYEDEKAVAILDINPANPGHLLVVPKEHYLVMPQVPQKDLEHMAVVVKKLSHRLLTTLQVGGTQIFVANGSVAGQKAQHFMVHVIPRLVNDGVSLGIPEAEEVGVEELKKVKRQLFVEEVPSVVEPPTVEAEITKVEKGPSIEDALMGLDAEREEPEAEPSEEEPEEEERKEAEPQEEPEEPEEEEPGEEEPEDTGEADEEEQPEERDVKADLDDIARLLNG